MKTSFKFALFLSSELLALALAANAQAATPRTPTFFARRDYPGLLSSCVQVADTNGDKVPDLISIQSNGHVTVLLGNGDGTFRAGPVSNTGAGGASRFVPID